MLRIAALLLIVFAVPLGAQTRDETLADIRQELSVLYVEVQRLKRELSTTGTPSVQTGGSSVLDRLDTLEAEMRRVTARAEELEFRINSVVGDGTRRIGDLEFRLCELETDCDIAELGDTPTLGGELPEGSVTGSAIGTDAGTDIGSGDDDGVEMAMGEQADFDTALAAYDGGDYAAAAEQFSAYTVNYPGGPLSGDAHFWRGQSHAALEEWSSAARAFLESFSGTPGGQKAPEALYMLGVSLDRIGQRDEACLTLHEVPVRFPGNDFAARAQDQMRDLGCS